MEDPANPTARKIFVLCFDGTGNKFSGTDSDSNILKIYRMLDRTQGNQLHYYQPGIGTYVTSTSMEHTSVFTRFKSWYDKAKDSAIGTAFAEHVMGGYKFLMRYYTPEDEIYFFGFSRGAYTARFLAEMLDHVGLLSAGNEELTRFAWKTFSKYQARRGGDSPEAKKKEEDMYRFMINFRDTFSRPIRRLRFLGLFDTVNSVPRFESAWMQRSKFPYTAHSSAKVIRHAVSIDERRAKFRQDLVTGSNKIKTEAEKKARYEKVNGSTNVVQPTVPRISIEVVDEERIGRSGFQKAKSGDTLGQQFHMAPEHPEEQLDMDRPPSPQQLAAPIRNVRASSLAGPMLTPSTENFMTEMGARATSQQRSRSRNRPRRRYSDMSKSQDIEEVWFAGNHADIGGGWPIGEDEVPLSHVPLVWMIQEAEKAGLPLDPVKMTALYCCPDEIDEYGNRSPNEARAKKFHDRFHDGGISGLIHDCLVYGGGLPRSSVLSWKMMEYLPFRRMDLKPDGSWHAIRWPLPAGETRDIPNDAKIHTTVLKRMREDENYRPGNLIVGGGGRGVRVAPKHLGIGDWELFKYGDDPVREVFIRKDKGQEKNGNSSGQHSLKDGQPDVEVPDQD